MADGNSRTKTIWIVVASVATGLVLCCGGVAVLGYLKVRDVVNSPGGIEGAARDLAQDLAGNADEVAQRFFTTALRDAPVADAYDQVSPALRTTVKPVDFETLILSIRRVMGPFRSARIRTANIRVVTGQGRLRELVYDAEFRDGPAVVRINVRDNDDDVPRVEMFRVESPRFMSALAGKLDDATPAAAEEDGAATEPAAPTDDGGER